MLDAGRLLKPHIPTDVTRRIFPFTDHYCVSLSICTLYCMQRIYKYRNAYIPYDRENIYLSRQKSEASAVWNGRSIYIHIRHLPISVRDGIVWIETLVQVGIRCAKMIAGYEERDCDTVEAGGRYVKRNDHVKRGTILYCRNGPGDSTLYSGLCECRRYCYCGIGWCVDDFYEGRNAYIYNHEVRRYVDDYYKVYTRPHS